MTYCNLSKYILLFLTSFLLCILLYSQPLPSSAKEASDFFNSNGKFFVVIAVLSIIFLGIYIFLFSINRRVLKLEKGKPVRY